jgi:hypothetical protein
MHNGSPEYVFRAVLIDLSTFSIFKQILKGATEQSVKQTSVMLVALYSSHGAPTTLELTATLTWSMKR